MFKYCFTYHTNSRNGKFEIGRELFENFGKLEDSVSKFSNIQKIGRNQMNEADGYIDVTMNRCLIIYSALDDN